MIELLAANFTKNMKRIMGERKLSYIELEKQTGV